MDTFHGIVSQPHRKKTVVYLLLLAVITFYEKYFSEKRKHHDPSIFLMGYTPREEIFYLVRLKEYRFIQMSTSPTCSRLTMNIYSCVNKSSASVITE